MADSLADRLGSPAVIALRRTIERGLRHPLLGPLCLVPLALLLVFTVAHGAHDQIHDGELIVCVALLVSALVSLVLPRLPAVGIVARPPARAPPCTRPEVPLRRTTALALAPLRL